MNTTEPLTRRPPTEPPGDAPLPAIDAPTFDGVADEILPLVDVVVVAGPPLSFVAAPWLLLVLMLSAPFAVLAALVVVWVLAAAVLAAVAGALAAPFLLARRLHRGHRAPGATALPRPSVARIDSGRAVA